MLNRRHLISLVGATVGAATVSRLISDGPAGAAAADTSAHGHHQHHAAGSGAAPAVAPFSVPMPVPLVLRPTEVHPDHDVYRLAVRPAEVELLPGLRTPVLTYGGQFVGPTIRARSGRPVVVRYRNELAEPANAHLHGGHVPAESDGHPMDVIQPGATRTNRYPNRQPGATLWYHGHTHHREAEHVYRGLHGFYLLEGEDERRLGLPSGPYDVPVMLTDAHFDERGALVYAPEDVPNRTTLLANGRPSPYFPVAARRYRLRLLNAATFRTFQVNLGGVEMIQIGSDGGLLPTPVPRTEITLTPGERVEVVVDFGRHPVGSSLVLADVSGPVLRFDVRASSRDDSRVPDQLRPLPPLPSGPTDRELTLQVDVTRGISYINGQPFDPSRVDATIRRGTSEIWRVTNADTALRFDHNLHLHLVQFRVLDRDGGPPLPGESGLKDTVLVRAGESVRIQATFGPYLGRYVYHCHMLEHSDGGMMGQFEVVS